MGNCLGANSTDDLTLLNGRNESARESIDQEQSLQYQVSIKFCVISNS